MDGFEMILLLPEIYWWNYTICEHWSSTTSMEITSLVPRPEGG